MKNTKTHTSAYFWSLTAAFIAVFFTSSTSFASTERKSIMQMENEEHSAGEVSAAGMVGPSEAQAAVTPLRLKTQALSKHILGFHTSWMGDAYETYDYSTLSTVAYFGAELSSTGKISDLNEWPHTDLIERAHAGGAKVVLTAILHDSRDLQILLRTPEHRTRAIENLLDQVTSAGADGLNIDFENIDGADRDNFTAFMSELSTAFRANMTNPEISIDVPGIDWGDAYDVPELLSLVDYIMIMGYDYHWSSGPEAGPVAPLHRSDTWGWQSVEWSVDYYLEQADGQAGKILLGVPYYGLDWPVSAGDFPNRAVRSARSLYYSGIQKLIADNSYEEQWNDESGSPYYTYDGHQVWYENARSLGGKYDLVEDQGLAGIGIWALGYDSDRGELQALLEERFMSDTVDPRNRSLKFITAPGVGGGPHVRTFLNDGTGQADDIPEKLFVYQNDFRGGVHIAAGDFDKDGVDEFVTAPMKTGGPFLRVFEKDGTERGIQIWPFKKTYRNGINIAAGDVDGDGKSEIAVVPEQGDAARVKIYRYNDEQTILSNFLAFGSYEVGGSVAFGDVDLDGEDEVIVGAGPGGGPHIRIFEIDGTPKPIDIFAFDRSYNGGINVASGDVDGDGKDEIVVAPREGRARIKVYRYGASRVVMHEWNAFDASVSGASLEVKDLNADGKDEVIVGAGSGSAPQVIAYDVANGMAQEANFYAYDVLFRGGVSVAVGDFGGASTARKE